MDVTTAADDELHGDKLHEECGVFGLWNVTDAAALTALGLHALQHRGQEATGIVTFDGARFHSHKGMGLVGDNFGDAKVIASLPGLPPSAITATPPPARRSCATCSRSTPISSSAASRSRITAT